jgi:hypothetical protein
MTRFSSADAELTERDHAAPKKRGEKRQDRRR